MSQPYDADNMQDKRYPNDWSPEDIQELQTNLIKGVSIPVNVEIKAEHNVFDFKKVKEILKGAKRIVIKGCHCRITRGNCDAPKDVCIYLDEDADRQIKNGDLNPRYVSYDEALDAVKLSHEAGLVHMAYTIEANDYPTVICSCCTCCCWALSGLTRYRMKLPLLTSDKVAQHDSDLCTSCGACVDRCQFDAPMMVDGKLFHNQEYCFGCGLCVTTCPSNSIILIDRY